MSVFLWGLFCFGFAVFIIGTLAGVREPFIPNDVVQDACCVWAPSLIAAVILCARFANRDPKKSFRAFFEERGLFGTFFSLSFVCILIMLFAAGMGAIGWSQAAAFIGPLPSRPVVDRGAIYVARGAVSRGNSSPLASIRIRFSDVDGTDSFAWPKKEVDVISECTDKKILISGEENALGLRVRSVKCKVGQ